MLKRAAVLTFCSWLASTAIAQAPTTPDGYDSKLWHRATALHHASTVVDTHCDTTSRILDEDFDMGPRQNSGHVDLPRLFEGGLDATFYSIYVASRFYGDETALFAPSGEFPKGDWPRPDAAGSANGSARRALAMIDGLVRTAARYPDQMSLCRTVDELAATVAAGRHAALMGIEGGHAIEGDLGLLRMFGLLGVRYMTLTHTNHNEYADSCAQSEPRWGGLNRLGVKVVKEMNRLGIMVDISHVSDATFYDALRHTRAPAICSHSSMRALCGHPRNITDDMLRALADNGGVVMINYNCGFLDDDYGKRSAAASQTRRIQEREARRKFADGSQELEQALAGIESRFPRPEPPTLSKLMDHIEHAIQVGGTDHVGLGSDFDGVSCVPKGMDDVTYLPRITYHLLLRGHSEETVRKVLGDNLLRVLGQVEACAASLAGEAPYTNDPTTDYERLAR
jgi:membrane dipeptidase